jgi:hypothetical protein
MAGQLRKRGKMVSNFNGRKPASEAMLCFLHLREELE